MSAMKHVFATLLAGEEPTFAQPSHYNPEWYQRAGDQVESGITEIPGAAVRAVRALPIPHRRIVHLTTIKHEDGETSLYWHPPGHAPVDENGRGFGRPSVIVQASQPAQTVLSAWIQSGGSKDPADVRTILNKMRGDGDTASLAFVLETLLPELSPTRSFTRRCYCPKYVRCVPEGEHRRVNADSPSIYISDPASEVIEAWVECPGARPTPDDVRRRLIGMARVEEPY